MEIQVTEFELFLLREGHRTMREQIKISNERKEAAEKEVWKKEAEKEDVEEEETEKETEVEETEVKETEANETEAKETEVEETKVKEEEETKDEAAMEEKMAAEKEVTEKEAAEKEVAEKPSESVAAAAVQDMCEDVVALLVEAKAAILARRARRAIVTLHQDLDSLTSLPTLPRHELAEVPEKEVAEKEAAEKEDKKEAAEKKDAAEKEVAKVPSESVESVAVLDMCEVVVALLVEAEAAMLATVGARRAIVAIHMDLDSLTSIPIFPRQERSEVKLLSEMEVLSEVLGEVLSEVEVLEPNNLDGLDKDAFGKGENHSWLTSKLASVQESLQSIVPHYTATSRSAGKSSDVTPDLEVVYKFGHGKNVCEDVFCKNVICEGEDAICGELASNLSSNELADKQVLELLDDKKVFELLADKKVLELLADKKVLGSNELVLAFTLGCTFKPFDRGKQKKRNERRKKKKVV